TLPDLADQFAADALLARLAVAHDTLRRRQHLDAQAVHDAPEAVHAPEDAAARLRHALDVRDHGLAGPVVLQIQVQRLALHLRLLLLPDRPPEARHARASLASSGGTAPEAHSGARRNRPASAPSRLSYCHHAA